MTSQVGTVVAEKEIAVKMALKEERDCNTSRTESKLVPLGAYSEPGTSGHFIDIKSFKLCNSAVRLA